MMNAKTDTLVSLGRILLLSLGWGSLLYASLTLTRGEKEYLPSVCGIWGCGPPTHVLVGWHLFWIVFFSPLFLLGLRKLGGTCLAHLGQGLIAVGLLAIVVIASYDLVFWWPSATELQRSYLDRRILFSIISLVEVPVLQILLAGTSFLFASHFKHSGDNCAPGTCSPPLN